MKYEQPEAISRQEASVELASGDWERVSMALLQLALHDPDPAWLQQTMLSYLSHPQLWVRRVAATCIGHIARIHGHVDTEVVVPALQRLLEDPDTLGHAEEALEDIKMFVRR